MHVSRFAMLRFCLWELFQVFVNIVILSLLILWGMQGLAMGYGVDFDWSAVFSHLLVSLAFLVLFPGQSFWSHRAKGPDGQFHTIVGRNPPPGHVEE